MRLHDAHGDRARALRVYHATSAALERELGAAPSDETRAAYEALVPAPTAAPVPRDRAFVGREAELEALAEAWRDAERGHARLALVTGEAGIGKTRLVEELRAWCEGRGAVVAEARSYPAEGGLAFAPVVAWLRAPPLAARRERLDPGRLAELGRLLPELGPPPAQLPEREQRQRLFDAAARALLAGGAPLLLVADDLQWADRESLQFVHYLLRSAAGAPLLLAATARREDADDPEPLHALATALRALDRCMELEIPRLSRAETAALAGQALDEAAAARLFAKTEGNPLFVVEALRAGWDDRVSPRVQAVIESRLARLSPAARDLAGVAAALGREFTAEVLSAVREEDVVPALDELWQRRIVRERGPDGYDFTHGRIREVAYGALSPARRRSTHLLLAQALERSGTGPPAVLAAHYERGGASADAVRCYLRAADAAQRLHLNADALESLERGRRTVAALPAGRARDEQELELVTAALAPLVPLGGYSDERLRWLQARGLGLSEALGAEPAPPLLRSAAVTALSSSEFERARHFAERLRSRGERDGDDVLLVESDYVLGIAAFWEGRLEAARERFESAVARYRPEQAVTHLLRYGMDPKVVCLSRLGNTLWFLGRTEEAAAARDAALALAEELGEPASSATARAFAAMLALELHDDDGLRGHVAALAARPREQDFAPIRTNLEALEGYLDVVGGRPAEGLARIRAVLAGLDGGDIAPGHRASMLRLLLEACAVAGDATGAVKAADELLAAPAGGLWRAEALRRRAVSGGELGAGPAAVRAELEQALAVARSQGAVALEGRVVESLAAWGASRRGA